MNEHDFRPKKNQYGIQLQPWSTRKVHAKPQTYWYCPECGKKVANKKVKEHKKECQKKR